ncbi:putative methyltransferase-domain-containing protein [Gautieria morchelliformis]|nr:putative methyltransferase-domain-containing protein [Gautieria morchelliformis]
MDPQPPSSSLPALRNIDVHSLSTVTAALINLRALYWPASIVPAAVRCSKPHVGQDVHDSGYASAMEEGDEEEEEDESVAVLRADAPERAFAVRWLTGFIARSEQWADKEHDNRVHVVEEAAALLALSADTQADGTLARQFSFAVDGGGNIVVELKDESYEQDHESVGLQTWGSACVLAEMVCADPGRYLGFDSQTSRGEEHQRTIRILELGAGTGLLSMVMAKLQLLPWVRELDVQIDVVATDFHPAVLENLQENVAHNFNLSVDMVRVEKLDWAYTPTIHERDKFDVILAADVIYDKCHGTLIKNCAAKMLRCGKGSIMWLIVPIRPTRTGELEGLDNVFCGNEGQPDLQVLEVKHVPRRNSVGRADEIGYRLFKIGWQHSMP